MENKEFNSFFQSVYGDRWDRLLSSMLKDESKVIRSCFPKFHCENHIDLEKINFLKESFQLPNEILKNWAEVRGKEDLLSFYIMDAASILVAQKLPIKAGDKVLDMCSAPGGKGLILSESLLESGEMIFNEPSQNRRERLTKIIKQYVPSELRKRVFVKGKDGNKYGLQESNSFDAILVDAPCSGEQHLLHSPNELSRWKEKQTKSLGQKQYSLLCSALLAAKSGGYIMYSTCSISPYENDGVLSKLLKKKAEMFEFVEIKDLPDFVEKTELGHIILPDNSAYGPMYLSLIRKR